MLAADRTLGSRFCILMTDGPSLGLAPLLAKEIFDVIQKINRMEPLTTILLIEQNVQDTLEVDNYAMF